MSLFYEKMLLRLCFVPVVHKEVTCQIVICFIKLILNCHFNDCRMSLFIINFVGYDMNWPCVRHNLYLYGTETVYT